MKLKPLLWALGALLAAVFYGSPYLALHEMRSAAAARDAGKLAGYIDFQAVRDSLKSGVQARLAGQQRNGDGEPTPASAMGAAVAGALLGPMVDALITPESLARVLQGQRPETALIPGRLNPATSPVPRAEPLETQMGYESPNRFVFSVKQQGDDEEPVDLVLRRVGVMNWKLAELRLP